MNKLTNQLENIDTKQAYHTLNLQHRKHMKQSRPLDKSINNKIKVQKMKLGINKLDQDTKQHIQCNKS